MNKLFTRARSLALCLGLAAMAAGCGSTGGRGQQLPSAGFVSATPEQPGADYIIGPLDALQIFVWRNPELTSPVSVRPDGRITVPLIEDLPAAGKTPTQLADDIEAKLGAYIQNPIVSVIVTNFNGPFSQQVRIVGQATRPQAIPYRANMTLLDAMIAVGGITEYAAGNRARLIRFDKAAGQQREYSIRIEDLLEDGKTSANVALQPGDVILIPESFF